MQSLRFHTLSYTLRRSGHLQTLAHALSVCVWLCLSASFYGIMRMCALQTAQYHAQSKWAFTAMHGRFKFLCICTKLISFIIWWETQLPQFLCHRVWLTWIVRFWKSIKEQTVMSVLLSEVPLQAQSALIHWVSISALIYSTSSASVSMTIYSAVNCGQNSAPVVCSLCCSFLDSFVD